MSRQSDLKKFLRFLREECKRARDVESLFRDDQLHEMIVYLMIGYIQIGNFVDQVLEAESKE